MMTKKSIVTSLLMLPIWATLLVSCGKDKEDEASATLSQTELKTVLDTEDMAGVADTALSLVYLGKTTGTTDKSYGCYAAEYTDTGFTATFNNCALNGTENVNGTVSVTYATDSNTATFTAMYTDFYVGNIKLNGSRAITLTNTSSENTIGLSAVNNMELDMGNGRIITLEGTRSLTFTVGDSLATTTFSIGGSWTVKDNDDTYNINVTDALVGQLSCAYITSGSMFLDKNGNNMIVAFGDGTCDALATVTFPNGTVKEIDLDN